MFISDNDITGEILLELDHEVLKQMQINSVGKRLGILKAIKELRHSLGLVGLFGQLSFRFISFILLFSFFLSSWQPDIDPSPTAAIQNLEVSLRDKGKQLQSFSFHFFIFFSFILSQFPFLLSSCADVLITALQEQLLSVKQNLAEIQATFVSSLKYYFIFFFLNLASDESHHPFPQ